MTTLSFTEIQNEAKKILEKMETVYANCNSYQDCGEVKISLNDLKGTRVVRLRFKTYFVRPDKFRFEWETQYSWKKQVISSMILCNGSETYFYFLGKKEKYQSLAEGLSTAAGVSHGGSSSVPFMLIEPNSSFILRDLVDEMLLDEESINGLEYFVISARRRKTGKPIKLWIGKRDYLLWKIERERKYQDYLVILEEIHEKVLLNQEIPTEIFTSQ